MTGLLAIGWALAVMVLGAGWARRSAAAGRAARLAAPRPQQRRGPLRAPLPRLAGMVEPVRQARDRSRRCREVRRELPVVVELLRVAVAGGSTPVEALRAVAGVAPTATGTLLAGVVRDVDLGLAFADAAQRAASPARALEPVLQVLVSSSELGVAVGPALGRVSAELRAELRRSAEARARTVPVRLLFPLVFLVLPAFLLLGVAPSVLAGMAG